MKYNISGIVYPVDEYLSFFSKENEKLNACTGKYGYSMDIKFVNECNANCSFCIEKGGFSPIEKMNIPKMIKAISKEKPDNLLILGGEPTLYPAKLISFLEKLDKVITKKPNIYLTTNGTRLTKNLIMRMARYIKTINISLYHYDLLVDAGIKKTEPIDIKVLKKEISLLKLLGVNVRINCLLQKGIMEKREDTDKMILFSKELRVDLIKFSEIQKNEDLFVDSISLFDLEVNNPFYEGCEQDCIILGQKVLIKMACGLIRKERGTIKEEDKKKMGKHTFKVLYNDGKLSDYWLRKEEDASLYINNYLEALETKARTGDDFSAIKKIKRDLASGDKNSLESVIESVSRNHCGVYSSGFSRSIEVNRIKAHPFGPSSVDPFGPSSKSDELSSETIYRMSRPTNEGRSFHC